MYCDDEFKSQIAGRLAAFDVNRIDTDGARHAAVAVAVTDGGHGAGLAGMPEHTEWQPDAALILTKRSAALRRHAGQWALPGGRLDEGETTVMTALREMHEEIGLKLETSSVLGMLDDYATRSGFVITPVVVWAGSRASFEPNPDEVASIHRIPVRELLRHDAPMLSEPHPDSGERPVLRMPVGESWIAAPTAAVLYQFAELCLCGRPTRVAHFDQPRFAWR